MNSLTKWFPIASVLLLLSGLSVSASAQTALTPAGVRTVCASSTDLAKAKEIMESPEFRAIVERTKASLRAKHQNSFAGSRPVSKYIARGRIFGNFASCSQKTPTGTAEPFASSGPGGVTIQTIISPDPDNPDPPTYYDFGIYGVWEGGDYMDDEDWWDTTVFSPVWDATLVANEPSQLCKDKYTGCASKTKYLKSAGMLACGSLGGQTWLQVPSAEASLSILASKRTPSVSPTMLSVSRTSRTPS